MIAEKEVLEALKLLQNVCLENNRKCNQCILRSGNGDCGMIVNSNGDVYESISEWQLKSYDNLRVILN